MGHPSGDDHWESSYGGQKFGKDFQMQDTGFGIQGYTSNKVYSQIRLLEGTTVRKNTKEKILENILIFLLSNLQTCPILTHFTLLPLITTEEMSIHLSKATPVPASGSSLAQAPRSFNCSLSCISGLPPPLASDPPHTHISNSFRAKTFQSCLLMLSLLHPCPFFLVCS